MNSVRNDALTVLFKVSSLITITRSVSGIAAFNSLKLPFYVKISIQIYKNTTFGVFCCTQHGISLYMLRMLVMAHTLAEWPHR